MSRFRTFASLKTEVSGYCNEDATAFMGLVEKAINQAYHQMMNADPVSPLWFRRAHESFSLAAGTRAYTDDEADAGASPAVAEGVLAAAGITDLGRIISADVGGYPCTLVDHDFARANALTFWDDNSTDDHPEHVLHEVKPLGSGLLEDDATPRARSVQNTLYFSYMPQSVQTVNLDYERTYDDLANDNDLPLMPPHYHQALVWGAMLVMEHFGKSAVAGNWAALFTAAIDEMKTESRTRIGYTDEPDEFARL